MIRYVIKRILTLIPIVLLVALIVYGIMSFSGGDPARMLLGTNAKEEDIAALREDMGLNDPFIVQYGRYIKNAVLHLDFGKSYSSKQPVIDEILARFPTTFKLTFISVLISVVVALPMGILSAIKQYSALDNVFVFLSMCLVAVPVVWLGLMLMILFSNQLGWLPSGGLESWKGYILPCITLSAGSIALYLRIMRSSMLEVVRQDYVRTARGKGIGNFKTIFRHAIKNALLPVITIIGLDFGYLLGGAIIIENVFSISGLGRLMVDAMRTKNIPVIMGSVIFLAVTFSVVNLIVDIIYANIDPRIKAEYSAYAAGKRKRRSVRAILTGKGGGAE